MVVNLCAECGVRGGRIWTPRGIMCSDECADVGIFGTGHEVRSESTQEEGKTMAEDTKQYERIDKQTDKAQTKICGCTYPDCPNAVEVNRYYAPAKARCNDHKGQTSSSVRAAVAKVGVTSEDAEPNRALAGLRCPFDDHQLDLHRVKDVGQDVFLTFVCDQCKVAIDIMPNWKALIIGNIPEEWQPLVQQLKDRQEAVSA